MIPYWVVRWQWWQRWNACSMSLCISTKRVSVSVCERGIIGSSKPSVCHPLPARRGRDDDDDDDRPLPCGGGYTQSGIRSSRVSCKRARERERERGTVHLIDGYRTEYLCLYLSLSFSLSLLSFHVYRVMHIHTLHTYRSADDTAAFTESSSSSCPPRSTTGGKGQRGGSGGGGIIITCRRSSPFSFSFCSYASNATVGTVERPAYFVKVECKECVQAEGLSLPQPCPCGTHHFRAIIFDWLTRSFSITVRVSAPYFYLLSISPPLTIRRPPIRRRWQLLWQQQQQQHLVAAYHSESLSNESCRAG